MPTRREMAFLPSSANKDAALISVRSVLNHPLVPDHIHLISGPGYPEASNFSYWHVKEMGFEFLEMSPDKIAPYGGSMEGKPFFYRSLTFLPLRTLSSIKSFQ